MVGFLFETPRGSHRLLKNGTEVAVVDEGERYKHQVRGEYLGQREVIRRDSVLRQDRSRSRCLLGLYFNVNVTLSSSESVSDPLDIFAEASFRRLWPQLHQSKDWTDTGRRYHDGIHHTDE